MAQFSVNVQPQRFDPYKNFKFRVKWDGNYVAGVSKVSSLKRTTEVVKHREGGDPSSSRKSAGSQGSGGAGGLRDEFVLTPEQARDHNLYKATRDAALKAGKAVRIKS